MNRRHFMGGVAALGVTGAASPAAAIFGRGTAGNFSPASLFSGRSSGAWFQSNDNTHLTVNSDGTGGAVASGGTVGRWLDSSGFGNHLSQANATLRPIYRAGDGVNFFYGTNNTTRTAALFNLSTTSFPYAGFSGGFTGWACGAGAAPFVDFGTNNVAFTSGGANQDIYFGYNDLFSFYINGALLLSRKVVVTWRSNGSNLIIRVNGVEYTEAAYANQTDPLTHINLSQFNGGNPSPSKMIELVVYDQDVGQGNIVALETYLRTVADTYDDTRSVAVYGDSLSVGIGSETCQPWHWLISNRPNSRWHACAVGGAHINLQPASTFLLFKGSAEGIAVIWMGTNDVLTGSSGATVAAALKAYSDTLRAGGMKVVVCTLQDISGFSTIVTDCNTQIAVDASHYDAIADLHANVHLQDSTNNTYFSTDHVHMLDAGYAIVASIVNAAMATV